MQLPRRRWHLALIWVLTGFAILISAQVFSQSGEPALVIPLRSYDAGIVWESEAISHSYEVRNEGTAELRILEVKPG